MGNAASRPASLDRALALLESGGNWSLGAMALAATGVTYFWSVSAGLPAPIAAVAALYGLAGALWLHASLLEFQRQRRRAASLPDYEKWNLVTTFTFAQAASLWADRRPELGLDDSAYAVYSMLKEQARAGTLDALAQGPEFHRGSLVLRGDLLRLAKRVRQRPRFLFNRHLK